MHLSFYESWECDQEYIIENSPNQIINMKCLTCNEDHYFILIEEHILEFGELARFIEARERLEG